MVVRNSTSPAGRMAAAGMIAALACACAPAFDRDEPDHEPQATQWIWGMRVNGLWLNGLPTDALAVNPLLGNQHANMALAMLPLHEETFRLVAPPAGLVPAWPDYGVPYLALQLENTEAQDVMRYLVTCALDDSQHLEIDLPVSGQRLEFMGGVGLATDWAERPPTDQELQWVSQCLAGLNNRQTVAVSLRGDHPSGVFTPSPIVSTVPVDNARQLIPSFESVVGTTYGPRNAGWQPHHVGLCNRGDIVTVGTGGPVAGHCGEPALGTARLAAGPRASIDTMVRVVAGIEGADSGPYAPPMWENDDACGTLYASVEFVCERDDFYFTVMTTSYSSDHPVDVEVEVSGAAYPAPEVDVFQIREMSAYGRILGVLPRTHVFVDASLTLHGAAGVSIDGSIYPEMTCCYSAERNPSIVHLNGRVCSQPGAQNCICDVAGACSGPPAAYMSNDYGDLCATIGPDGSYGSCMGRDGRVWERPITVFLNRPDDTMDSAPF